MAGLGCWVHEWRSWLQMTSQLTSHGGYAAVYKIIKQQFQAKCSERSAHVDPQAKSAADSITTEQLEALGRQTMGDNTTSADMHASLRMWCASTGSRNDDALCQVLHDWEDPRPYKTIGEPLKHSHGSIDHWILLHSSHTGGSFGGWRGPSLPRSLVGFDGIPHHGGGAGRCRQHGGRVSGPCRHGIPAGARWIQVSLFIHFRSMCHRNFHALCLTLQ